mgnify:CR=1 FL=1
MSVQRLICDAAELIRAYPPNFVDPNKRLVMDIAFPHGMEASGSIAVSRWQPMPLPAELPPAEPVVRGEDGFFTYGPTDAGWCAWHVNFADPMLFGFYGGGLFAQDEMQVTEHPALASVARALSAAGIEPYTVESHRPTPVLVKGVERRCVVDTDPALEAGRMEGLYGNRFARAPAAAIRSATQRMDPPTITNILAMAALPPGRGTYSRADVVAVLVTAYTGFSAAVHESDDDNVEIHTGFWGCGAFGGNRVLMTILQIVAARMAGVDRLVMHLGDSSGRRDLVEAERAIRVLYASETTVEGLVSKLVARGDRWGVSDGN